MNEKKLKSKQKNLHEEITRIAKEKGLSKQKPFIKPIKDGVAAIKDGVADIKEYLKSTPKIMWIMKEPYDCIKKGKPSGGGYSIPDDVFSGNGGNNFRNDIKTKPIWRNIIYATYGILKNKK